MKTLVAALGLCALGLTVVAAQQTGSTSSPTQTMKAASAGPYNEQADAKADIAAALALAQKDHKNVFLDFGGNWCPDCIALSKLLDDGSVKPFYETNFHEVRIDVGRFNKNTDISDQYGGVIKKGVPAVVILAPDGHMVDSTVDGSYESARHFTAAQVLDSLKKWAPKPND
jgi:thiol:disulfide interchange protein